MAKAVLISIQPKWCEKIASGEKTIEVRKTRPKLEMPFKVYIYKTKGKKKETIIDDVFTSVYGGYYGGQGKVIGEFVCDRIDEYECSSDGFGELTTTCGTCLTYDEILNYCNGNDLYGWHISDLKIYDKPKELSEFKSVKVINRYHKKEYDKYEKLSHSHRVQVTYFDRPPQSWCYVEELKEN